MLLNELGGQAFRLIKKRLNQMKRFLYMNISFSLLLLMSRKA